MCPAESGIGFRGPVTGDENYSNAEFQVKTEPNTWKIKFVKAMRKYFEVK